MTKNVYIWKNLCDMLILDFIDNVSVNCTEQSDALRDFARGIYPEAFPNPDEREPFENILERIKDKDAYPRTFAVLGREDGALVGAQIVDYYRDCCAAEVIYIAVDPSQRGKGYGKKLLTEGLALLKNELAGKKLPVDRIFFETENPFIEQEHSGMDPLARFSFFARNGAARIPVDYVQPPLSDGLGWARNLFLCTLPQFADIEDGISSEDLKAFLNAFYKGLDVPEDSGELKMLMDSVDEASDNEGVISYQPLAEHSIFRIPRFSVAWHFKTVCPSNPSRPNPIYNSYEADLMNYSYQDFGRRPVRTSHVRLLDDMEILMPQAYVYSSEGVSYYRVSEHLSFPVSLSLSRSINNGGTVELVNMVVYYDGGGVGEFDLIKLITAFGSKQEGYQPSESIRFRCMKSGRIYTCGELLCEYAGENEYVQLHSGVTELDMARIRTVDGEPAFASSDEFMKLPMSDEFPAENDWNKVMCGIVLGIMDHQRMNAGEIYDTFKPMNIRQSSFMILSRGHLLKMEYDEESEKIDKILISPYLLIPSAVLCINEIILDRNEELLKAPVPSTFSYYRKSVWLSSHIMRISQSLGSEYYQDLFQYESEQTILQLGSAQRGHERRRSYLEGLISEQHTLLDSFRSKHEMTSSTIESMLLLVLAVMQVITAVREDFVIFGIVTAVAVVLYGGGIYLRRNS